MNEYRCKVVIRKVKLFELPLMLSEGAGQYHRLSRDGVEMAIRKTWYDDADDHTEYSTELPNLGCTPIRICKHRTQTHLQQFATAVGYGAV